MAVTGTSPPRQSAKPQALESTYHSLASANRQKVFESVLNQTRSPRSSGLPEMSKASSTGESSTPVEQNPVAAVTGNTGAGQAAQMGSMKLGDMASTVFLEVMAHSGSSGALKGYAQAVGRSRSTTSSRLDADGAACADKLSKTNRTTVCKDLGSLCARFESGEAGVAAVGYDATGGTSYGIYQISSRQGSMKAFLGYLDDQAPDLAKRLRSAGSADTGGTSGGMPREWKRIATEDPDRFRELQTGFIKESYYDDAATEIQERTGLDPSRQSEALQQVVWSTAVQHGSYGAAKVFDEAVGRLEKQGKPLNDKNLIEAVYAQRATKFGSSSARVRAAVRNRLGEEKLAALSMLGEGTLRA